MMELNNYYNNCIIIFLNINLLFICLLFIKKINYFLYYLKINKKNK